MKKTLVLIISIILILSMCFAFTSCGKVDYESAEALEEALNAGEDCEGKIAVIKVVEYNPTGALGYTIWSGEHLNFISAENPKVKEGDEIKVKITKVKSLLGSWIINYEKA